MPEVSTWAELENQKQLRLRLKCIVQSNDKWMLRIGEHVTLCLRIPHQVVALDLVLRQHLHRVEFSRLYLPHEVDFAERTLTEALERHEVIGANPQLFLFRVLRRSNGLLARVTLTITKLRTTIIHVICSTLLLVASAFAVSGSTALLFSALL